MDAAVQTSTLISISISTGVVVQATEMQSVTDLWMLRVTEMPTMTISIVILILMQSHREMPLHPHEGCQTFAQLPPLHPPPDRLHLHSYTPANTQQQYTITLI